MGKGNFVQRFAGFLHISFKLAVASIAMLDVFMYAKVPERKIQK